MTHTKIFTQQQKMSTSSELHKLFCFDLVLFQRLYSYTDLEDHFPYVYGLVPPRTSTLNKATNESVGKQKACQLRSLSPCDRYTAPLEVETRVSAADEIVPCSYLQLLRLSYDQVLQALHYFSRFNFRRLGLL